MVPKKETLKLLEQLSLMSLKNQQMIDELTDAIHLASRLDFVCTENVEPLYSLPNKANHLRSDEVCYEVTSQDIIGTAEKTIDGLYCSPTSKMTWLNEKLSSIFWNSTEIVLVWSF